MGGSSTDAYDSKYNARLATLMEGADERTELLFNDYYYKGGRDYNQEQIAAGRELLPQQTELAGLQLGSAIELNPLQTELSKATLGLDLQAAGQKSGIMSKFYESLGKNNPELQASQAGTNMAEAYKNVRANDMMAQKRQGLYRPGVSTGLGYSEARDTAGAMTSARTSARKDNLNEYAMGLSL